MPLRLFLDRLTVSGVPGGLGNSLPYDKNIFLFEHPGGRRGEPRSRVEYTFCRRTRMAKFLSQTRQGDVAERRLALPGFS